MARRGGAPELDASAARATEWLAAATDQGRSAEAAPIGLYFARLWYFEDLYPIIFALAGLREWQHVVNATPGQRDPG